MGTQWKPGNADAKVAAASYPTETASPTPPARSKLAPLNDPLLQKRYQELTRKHLNGLLHGLFAEFTGLHFHVAWAPSLPHAWKAMTLPTGCAMCRRWVGTWESNDGCCHACGSEHLATTLRAVSKGHRFTCRLGVRNHWVPITVRGVTIGIAYLQALAGSGPRRRVRGQATGPRTKMATRPDFHRAGRLLRLMVHYAETSDLAELRMVDLTSARQAVTALENEQARLRQKLQRIMPTTATTPAAAGSENHTEQVVHAALAIVNQRYSQPLTLQQCARSLGLNAAYLSTLFSRAVGVPFKAYLTELRLQKARELLGDPSRHVSEVADAVGYASENRFRIAFKKATGFAPRTWRETFHAAG